MDIVFQVLLILFWTFLLLVTAALIVFKDLADYLNLDWMDFYNPEKTEFLLSKIKENQILALWRISHFFRGMLEDSERKGNLADSEKIRILIEEINELKEKVYLGPFEKEIIRGNFVLPVYFETNTEKSAYKLKNDIYELKRLGQIKRLLNVLTGIKGFDLKIEISVKIIFLRKV
jgi:hypothetical protein